MEEIVKENGFESLEEFNSLISSVYLSIPSNFQKFENWKFNDGTKEGFLKIDFIKINRI